MSSTLIGFCAGTAFLIAIVGVGVGFVIGVSTVTKQEQRKRDIRASIERSYRKDAK